MGIFENFDATTWALFGLLAAAAIAYYFWPESTRAAAEVTVDEATRKQAKPLIALASDRAGKQLFQLSHMPLRVMATEELRTRLAGGTPPDLAELTEALWAQQRAMITRLESELDYAQQADVSEHFAIAAPANQPEALLEKTLKELESLYGQVRSLLHTPKDRPLWHGRAMVLMLSNRKLFDHVAWLTSSGLTASASGAFTLAQDDVVMITIYATRLGGFARPLTLQVCRAAVHGMGGEKTPQWVEYGLAQWLTTKALGKAQLMAGEQPPAWDEKCKAVVESAAWKAAADDSVKLEHLVIASGLLMDEIMSRQPDRLLKDLSAQSDNLGWVCELFPASSASA